MANPITRFLADLCEDPYRRRAFGSAPGSHLAAAGIEGDAAHALLGSDSGAIYRAAEVDAAPAPKLIWSR